MSKVLKISEALSIAMHSMGLMASAPERVFSNREVASTLRVSGAHLSKVMQRLSRGGYVSSARGPSGGFRLARPAEDITLLEIFEQIEGPLDTRDCLLPERVCTGADCVLGGLIEKVNSQVAEYLSGTRLSDIVNVYGKKKKGGGRGGRAGSR